MASNKSKAELKSIIERSFQRNTGAKVLHVTSDGQCFLDENKSFAERHARISKLSVMVANRMDYEVPAEPKKEKKPKTSSAQGEALTADQYETATVDQLKAELTKRDISFAPNSKPETLIKKLVEDDAVKATSGSGTGAGSGE